MFVMDAYDAYRKFLAIKLHFKNSDYDYFKYRGSVKANRDSFETRKDKYFFHKLSKKEDLDLFLASNLKDNIDVWVGDLFEEKYENAFKQSQKRLQSLEYNFKVEMRQFESLDDAFLVRNGEWPKILYSFRRGDVSIETMVIVMLTAGCFDYWNENISDTIVWPRMRQQIQKYSKFIRNSINTSKFVEIMQNLY